MSKRKRRAGSARRLSNTVVPVLVTVGLAAGTVGAAGGIQGLASAALAANPCNPCNPCAAGAAGQSSKCEVPRLAAAKANPCAAKNPCSPCAAKNPCNPCAANPCNPCGAAPAVELKPDEAIAAYECLKPEMGAAYTKSGHAGATTYAGWPSFNSRPYVSATHGGRYVNNYANETGKPYGRFEKASTMPVGTVLAKDSFIAHPNGKLSVGPLFLMEKMKAGFHAPSGDWRYTLIGPNGAIVGETNGQDSKNVQFCAECHATVADDQDHMFLMPDEVRKKPN